LNVKWILIGQTNYYFYRINVPTYITGFILFKEGAGA
jgi:hypothetical protein